MLASGRSRLLLLLGVSVWSSAVLRAQVAPPLSAPLGTKAEIEPVSNLAFDLLVPQRPSASDPTGANILTNALSPFVIAIDFSSATAQTDTALRDSTQSGRFNPYGLGPSRGALLSGGGESDDAAGMTVASRMRTGQSVGIGSSDGSTVPASGADYDPGYGAEQNSSYRSSWGASSSFSSADASSWGVRAAPIERMGRGTDTSSSIEGPLAGGMSGASNSPPTGHSQSASGATTESRRGAGLTGLPGLQTGATGTKQMTPGSRPASGAEAPVGSKASRSEEGPYTFGRSGGMSGRAAAMGGGEAPRTLEGKLLFSPRSYAGYSFGAAPFSPPGLGAASFLNPNIFDTRPVTLAKRSGAGARARRLYRQRTFGADNGFATSASKYGLASHLGTERSRLGSRRGNSSADRLLTKSRAGTESPYKSGTTR